ncbi:MAG: hypothetical protein K8M05_21865 [Deltaproteobacteria bacterium]|nr:hypothetical protein [Kofleriaceae bacterium]
MSPRIKTILAASLSAAIAFAIAGATRATAGRKDLWTVTIDAGAQRAYGSLGSARNSADPRQSIGCSTFYDPTNRVNQATCIAVDAKGNFARCMTQDPTIVAVTFAFTSDSQIAFSWDDHEECRHIAVSNLSNHEPKLP